MSDEQSLLAAIYEDPYDDDLRRVWADWLEEHGQEDRAEFVRVQLELVQARGDGVVPTELQRREQELLERHRDEWTAHIRVLGPGIVAHFERGLCNHLRLDRPEQLEGLPPLPWLERLTLSAEFDWFHLASLIRQPNLRWLGLDHTGYMNRATEMLCRCPGLVAVANLDEDIRFDADGQRTLRQSCLRRFHQLPPHKKRTEAIAFFMSAADEGYPQAVWDRQGKVKRLTLECDCVDEDDLAYLACVPELEALTIGANPISPASLAVLGGLPSLRELALWNVIAGLDDEGSSFLEALTALEELTLTGARLSDRAFARLGALRHLRELNLSHCTNASSPALAALGRLERLEDLTLGYTDVSDASLAPLASLKNLRWINLNGTAITDEGIANLHLPNLKAVELCHTGVSVEAARQLVDQVPRAVVVTGHSRPFRVIRNTWAPIEYRRTELDHRFSMEIPDGWAVRGSLETSPAIGLYEQGSVKIPDIATDEAPLYITLTRFACAPDAPPGELMHKRGYNGQPLPQRPDLWYHYSRAQDIPAAAARFTVGLRVVVPAVWRDGATAYVLTATTTALAFPRWEELLLRMVRSAVIGGAVTDPAT